MSCPGLYCGRTILSDSQLSECGPCPRGFRRNETSHICELCTDDPLLYDWLYLGFVVLVMLVLHCFFIDMLSMRRSFTKDILILHSAAFIEVIVAAFLSLLLSHPIGSFTVYSCRVRSISDWYTLLHNPSPNYDKKIYCSQEAVYPLYTTIFLFYGLSMVLMLIYRPWLCKKYLPRQSKMSIYAALYFIPILIVIHALIGGLLYYCFPHLTLILSVISCAAHFAIKLDQSIESLILSTLVEPRNLVILIGHWCLHAYGIISITQLINPPLHASFILLVPLPAVIYILTARFTDPNRFQF
ncbi:JNK1/MAPK8-associated membrane protein [Diorhabda carinulata]|uniref:JNK1/MAPK8-associated membrane protein n=1 Tax=Diorhabda sublineata TaxID=1163346 RepID=UPI0024E07A25|nr:JNK1/MAPK8-associated membrane protein [Diorhabda sublineata]XP_057663812.1 JNK1/MAPK8-associated membrane protein [Diorhabda carinulata]